MDTIDFETFKNQAIADMKAGKSLIGKEGVFTPLMKEFLEAASKTAISAVIRGSFLRIKFLPHWRKVKIESMRRISCLARMHRSASTYFRLSFA